MIANQTIFKCKTFVEFLSMDIFATFTMTFLFGPNKIIAEKSFLGTKYSQTVFKFFCLLNIIIEFGYFYLFYRQL